MAVPREALQQDGDGEYVMVVDDQDEAQRRPVLSGLSDPDYVSVLEGLEAGERVVTVASIPIRPGQKVRTGDEGGEGRDGGPQQPDPPRADEDRPPGGSTQTAAGATQAPEAQAR